MSKRRRFVISSLLLSLGFLGIAISGVEQRLLSISVLTILTLILFVWSEREGLVKNASLLTFILPVSFTLGVGLFWFLLPSTLATLVPIFLLYGIGIYALCAISNILLVSVIRTIALTRAAKSVGFVITLFTSFLLFDTVISLKTYPWVTVALVFLITGILSVQSLWASTLDSKLSKQTITFALVISYAITVISLLLFFWPVTVVIGSLALTVLFYVCVGLAQAELESRLFASTVREYLSVGVIVFIVILFATNWRG